LIDLNSLSTKYQLIISFATYRDGYKGGVRTPLNNTNPCNQLKAHRLIVMITTPREDTTTA
jgi:hypothetical protein